MSNHVGLHNEAERFYPDYSLLLSPIDYHATHAMRGCTRKCGFCGTWKIEPNREDKATAELITELKAIGKSRVIFFDNNFLENKQIKQILEELAALRINNKPVIFESQSGFDGRFLEKDSELAKLLKKARFQNVRIAWDNAVSDYSSIKKQIGLHPSHWTKYVRVTDRITLTPYWEKGACHETKEIQQRVQTPSSRRTVKRHQFLSPALPQT